MTTGNGIRRGLMVMALMLIVTIGAGCSSALVGTWKADPIPQDMDFYIASVEFKDNGDYRAVARVPGGDTKNLRGKYEFDGFKLKLMRPGAAPRIYPATYYMNGTLQIKSDGQSQRLRKQ